MDASQTPSVKTRILVLSDTHGMSLEGHIPTQSADVAIHCGDLTEGSKLSEFRTTLQLLRSIHAPLKLVIAGNHDFTLDRGVFRKKVEEAGLAGEPDLVAREYGREGEAQALFAPIETDETDETNGIRFLHEGTHRFRLQNGALLTVYASPYTPCYGEWGFQEEGHEYRVEAGTNIAVTHGPPLGVLDRTERRERAGCPRLFAAVARARPQLHCFGHVHAGWGAKMVTWRPTTTAAPSFLTDLDNGRSHLIEQLSTLQAGKFDTADTAREKEDRLQRYAEQRCCQTSHCRGDAVPLKAGSQTLFVNAAIQGSEEMPVQLPWLVDLELPLAEEST